LLCGFGKSLGRAIHETSLYRTYEGNPNVPPEDNKLLDNPNVPPEDKQTIKELLKKPWNPYMQSALNTRNSECVYPIVQ